MKKAPIVVSVYDRVEHFKSCIDSLAKNKEAIDSFLYISSDGPKDAFSASRVAAIREYINTITGFKKVIPFRAKDNTQGEIKRTVYEEVKSNHATYIHTEDDNIFSPYALNFFNEGLKIFADAPEIHAICGYQYPGFPSNVYEQVYLKCVSAWGIALWREKDLDLKLDQKNLASEIFANKTLFNQISGLLPHLPPMSKAIIDGKLRAGDVTRCNYIFKHNQVAVFPSVSLVRNIGHDGSGMHSGVDEKYSKQSISGRRICFVPEKLRNPTVADTRWIFNFFGGQKAVFRNRLLFIEHNTSSAILKLLIRYFLKATKLIYFQIRFLRTVILP